MKKEVVYTIKQSFVSAKDSTLLVLSEASCIIEKTALDSITLHYDLAQEIPDSNVLTYLADKAVESKTVFVELTKQFSEANLQEKFNDLLAQKQKEFDRMISTPLAFDNRSFGAMSFSEQLHAISSSNSLDQLNAFERRLQATL